MNSLKKNLPGAKEKNAPKIRIDKKLDAYSGKNLFPEKLENANKMIATLNLNK